MLFVLIWNTENAIQEYASPEWRRVTGPFPTREEAEAWALKNDIAAQAREVWELDSPSDEVPS